jgi:hypothetical protein
MLLTWASVIRSIRVTLNRPSLISSYPLVCPQRRIANASLRRTTSFPASGSAGGSEYLMAGRVAAGLRCRPGFSITSPFGKGKLRHPGATPEAAANDRRIPPPPKGGAFRRDGNASRIREGGISIKAKIRGKFNRSSQSCPNSAAFRAIYGSPWLHQQNQAIKPPTLEISLKNIRTVSASPDTVSAHI